MPEYVYALHDFTPENDDEVSFHLGERIEVIEKDDAYNDGWWQGRNTSGKAGLFPQSYTSPNPPAGIASSTDPSASSQPSSSADESSTPKPTSETQEPPPAILLNGQDTNGHDIGVMTATMTDVQQAIEQLGKRRGELSDAEDTHSFSFASSRGGADTENETDTEFELSDVEAADESGPRDHKRTRQKLAEKARQALADAERLEMIGMARTTSNRSYVPPIQVELSDESEGDDEDEEEAYHPRSATFQRRYSHIPEEDEEVESSTLLPGEAIADQGSEYSTNLSMPDGDETEDTATATRATFADVPPSPTQTDNPSTRRQSPPDTMMKRTSTPLMETMQALPSPVVTSDIMARQQRQSSSSTSASVTSPSSAHAGDASTSNTVSTLPTPIEKKEKTHPSEWTLDDVVDWLKSKGFDQDVCEKFIEQEITGDVLLELDVNLLKTEIGIMAFGKRMRIANAITDLRRPPSISYSDHPDQPSPLSAMIPGQSPHLYDSPQSYGGGLGHARNTSLSQSHHSYPGSFTATSSINGISTLLSPDSAGGDLPSPVTSTLVDSSLASEIGGSSGTITKPRPSQLSLSPSDGALNASVKAVSGIPEETDEDRAALSEGEAGRSSSMRRRLFGRPHDSAGSVPSPRHSTKDSLSPTSLVHPENGDQEKEKDKEKEKSSEKEATPRHGRSKKSVDVGKSSDRLSLFGGSISGALGKNRKPPPKYSGDDATLSEKNSSFHLPRLYSSSGRRASGRPTTPGAAMGKSHSTPAKDVKESTKESRGSSDSKEKEPHVLRKRTSSYPGPSTSPTLPHDEKNVASPLKSGQSILEQIGTPDHSGWMRKRGDRYNSWKSRYFVLKGPHLYCLKSESTSQTKIKGYINIVGYRVTVDENLNPGKYGFRIEHEQDKMHFFSSDDKSVIREWMKAIMKATIARDYTQPVISSCNIPTIPLMVAQAMNPAPRPPSPTAREATQKALRRDNPNQLSSRDARVLMGLPHQSAEPAPSFMESPVKSAPPPRSSRRKNSAVSVTTPIPIDDSLVEWANSHLPSNLRIKDPSTSIYGALQLFRIAESVKGRPSSPPVPDSAFPADANDEKLDGLFKLFDFMLDNEVKMGSISINDVRQGNREKIIQMLKALKAWEEKRKALAQSIGKGSVAAAGFMAPNGTPWTAM
ncbi:hypothetical protein CPB85DRAFT_1439599 [Mucidula mucida]|nr:hypothetical protein CPB85DRAFT_1439599 [Mucidula mucida]